MRQRWRSGRRRKESWKKMAGGRDWSEDVERLVQEELEKEQREQDQK